MSGLGPREIFGNSNSAHGPWFYPSLPSRAPFQLPVDEAGINLLKFPFSFNKHISWDLLGEGYDSSLRSIAVPQVYPSRQTKCFTPRGSMIVMNPLRFLLGFLTTIIFNTLFHHFFVIFTCNRVVNKNKMKKILSIQAALNSCQRRKWVFWKGFFLSHFICTNKLFNKWLLIIISSLKCSLGTTYIINNKLVFCLCQTKVNEKYRKVTNTII